MFTAALLLLVVALSSRLHSGASSRSHAHLAHVRGRTEDARATAAVYHGDGAKSIDVQAHELAHGSSHGTFRYSSPPSAAHGAHGSFHVALHGAGSSATPLRLAHCLVGAPRGLLASEPDIFVPGLAENLREKVGPYPTVPRQRESL